MFNFYFQFPVRSLSRESNGLNILRKYVYINIYVFQMMNKVEFQYQPVSFDHQPAVKLQIFPIILAFYIYGTNHPRVIATLCNIRYKNTWRI